MGNWKIIEPVAETNLCENPSFETGAAGWTTAGTNTIAQSGDQAKFGIHSLKFTYGNIGNMCIYAVTLPTASTTYVGSAWIYVPTGSTIVTDVRLLFLNFAGGSVVSYNRWVDGVDPFDTWFRVWQIYNVGVDVIGTIEVDAWPPPVGGTGTYYIDGIDIVEASELSTHIDGDQPGCEWNGVPHASKSLRSGAYRGGGFIKDLKDDYKFAVETAIGIGMPPVTLSHDSFSLLPGGELNGIKTEIRPFTLAGNITGTGADCQNLHGSRQALEKILAHDTYPKSGDGWQPVRLRYTGADVTKEADVHYARGLEGALGPEQLKIPTPLEKVALGFEQDSVFWSAIGDGSQVLDTNDSATFRGIAGRLKSTGQWDDLGLTANPTTGAAIYAILIASDGTVYVGGDFTGMDGVAGRDYIARYDVATDTWATVGGNSDFNGVVYALAEGPDGTVYAGGAFTNCAGDAAADGLAQWDGSNWSAAGAGSVTEVRALTFGLDGTLYIGGVFNNFGGVANADNLAQWDGSAYTAVGGVAGPNGGVYGLAIRANGNLLLVGAFTTAGGVAADYVAEWDSSNFSELGNGVNGRCDAVVTDSSDSVYIGGTFTQDGDGNTLSRVGKLSAGGTIFEQLGSGVNGDVDDLDVGPDGMLYVCGDFNIGGWLLLAGRMARWNGSSWMSMDTDLPPSGGSRVVRAGASDPIIKQNYDLFVGLAFLGTGHFAGLTTTTNDGNTLIYPQLVVTRSGGTTAKLKTLRNEITGKELAFDYSLLDGETLTVDLAPTAKTIVSSMFGSRPDAILAGSDFGQWALLPDDNDVTCFVTTTGAPTVTAYLLWKTLWKGID